MDGKRSGMWKIDAKAVPEEVGMKEERNACWKEERKREALG